MTKRTIEKRFRSHLYEAKVKKYNMYLHNSIRKYGTKHFIIELIETNLDYDQAALQEQFYIRTYKTIQPHGYNEHEGGKGGCKNASPELRQKLSDAKKGKSTSWNRGIKSEFVPWNKGLTKDTDERVKNNGIMSLNAKKDKPSYQYSIETRKIMSEKKKLYWIKRRNGGILFPAPSGRNLSS